MSSTTSPLSATKVSYIGDEVCMKVLTYPATMTYLQGSRVQFERKHLPDGFHRTQLYTSKV